MPFLHSHSIAVGSVPKVQKKLPASRLAGKFGRTEANTTLLKGKELKLSWYDLHAPNYDPQLVKLETKLSKKR